MDNRIISDNRPNRVVLEKGKEYYFCACGRSKTQPFCDGSHSGTGIEPLVFVAEQDGEAKLCMCKHSGNLPFCDGSHHRFSADHVGCEAPE